MVAGMKDVKEAQIGDTLYLQGHPVETLPGFKPAKPMVFAGKPFSHPLLADGLKQISENWRIKPSF